MEQMELKEKTRADELFDGFARFHGDNPGVWSLFKRFTFDTITAGRENYSSYAIFHRIRWHTEIETGEECVKINNNHTPYYSRLFHAAYPKYDGFFRNRERITESRPAAGGAGLHMSRDAGEEKELNKKLLRLLSPKEE